MSDLLKKNLLNFFLQKEILLIVFLLKSVLLKCILLNVYSTQQILLNVFLLKSHSTENISTFHLVTQGPVSSPWSRSRSELRSSKFSVKFSKERTWRDTIIKQATTISPAVPLHISGCATHH